MNLFLYELGLLFLSMWIRSNTPEKTAHGIDHMFISSLCLCSLLVEVSIYASNPAVDRHKSLVGCLALNTPWRDCSTTCGSCEMPSLNTGLQHYTFYLWWRWPDNDQRFFYGISFFASTLFIMWPSFSTKLGDSSTWLRWDNYNSFKNIYFTKLGKTYTIR